MSSTYNPYFGQTTLGTSQDVLDVLLQLGITQAELNQIANIGTTSISNSTWTHLGGINQALSSTSHPIFDYISTQVKVRTPELYFSTGAGYIKQENINDGTDMTLLGLTNLGATGVDLRTLITTGTHDKLTICGNGVGNLTEFKLHGTNLSFTPIGVATTRLSINAVVNGSGEVLQVNGNADITGTIVSGGAITSGDMITVKPQISKVATASETWTIIDFTNYAEGCYMVYTSRDGYWWGAVDIIVRDALTIYRTPLVSNNFTSSVVGSWAYTGATAVNSGGTYKTSVFKMAQS